MAEQESTLDFLARRARDTRDELSAAEREWKALSYRRPTALIELGPRQGSMQPEQLRSEFAQIVEQSERDKPRIDELGETVGRLKDQLLEHEEKLQRALERL